MLIGATGATVPLVLPLASAAPMQGAQRASGAAMLAVPGFIAALCTRTAVALQKLRC
jgi:hypothetical protein